MIKLIIFSVFFPIGLGLGWQFVDSLLKRRKPPPAPYHWKS